MYIVTVDELKYKEASTLHSSPSIFGAVTKFVSYMNNWKTFWVYDKMANYSIGQPGLPQLSHLHVL